LKEWLIYSISSSIIPKFKFQAAAEGSLLVKQKQISLTFTREEGILPGPFSPTKLSSMGLFPSHSSLRTSPQPAPAQDTANDWSPTKTKSLSLGTENKQCA